MSTHPHTPDSLLDPPVSAWIEIPASWGDPARSFIFARPVAVWQANDASEVCAALDRVDAFQRQGLYVVGFLAYEAAPAFEPAIKVVPRGLLPLAWFAAFRQPENVPPPAPREVAPASDCRLLMGEDEYCAAVRCALDHIRAGDIYQVNLTVRAELETDDLPYDLFRALADSAPVPHAAYLDTGDAHIVSLSPELFLRRRGKIIESRPMKGTAARKPSWEEDEAARRRLAADEKNRAENVMIVDLVRSDLGRICRAGTITVPELWRVDRFPTVHQMTSLVRGELRPNLSLVDILAATFPPGSVTGAPKIRTCEIIAELEQRPRGVYCGAIGLFLPGGDFECSVAIRTLEVRHGRALLGVGAGIVADSDPAAEWRETLLKCRFARQRPRPFSLYETLRFDPGSGYRNLRLHLRRLHHSCDYFNRPFPLRAILSELRSLQPSLAGRAARVRLDVEHERVSVESEFENRSWSSEGLVVMIAGESLDPDDFRLYHKSTLRPEKYRALDEARAQGAHECLFLNTRGELAEGALSNIMLKLGGTWHTPALSCGLLPGVWRERQLRSGRCREAILHLEDLARAEEVCMVNAVRGEGRVVRVMRADGCSLYARENE